MQAMYQDGEPLAPVSNLLQKKISTDTSDHEYYAY